MSVVLWGKEEERMRLEEIKRGLLALQRQRLFDAEEIHILTGPFSSYYGREFAAAELLFVYFSSAGEDFCRFLVTHRRYTEKTVFLFGLSYACFDSQKITNYYRIPQEDYLVLADRRDYFYEAGLKQLLCFLQKRRLDGCQQAG